MQENRAVHSTIAQLWIYIIITTLFSIAIHSTLYFNVVDIKSYWLDGEILPIFSPDAGLYGYYGAQILEGREYPFVSEYMPGYLLALVSKITSIELHRLMFYLPALIASLITIPILLISYALNLLKVGFVAALIGSVCVNYYTRSHLGYMDTDTLNLLLPWLAVAFATLALQKRSMLYALLSALMLLSFRMWYHSSAAILIGIICGFLLVTLLFFRRAHEGYVLVLLGSIAMVPVAPFVSLLAILGASFIFFILKTKSSIGIKIYIFLFIIGVIGSIFVLDISHFVDRALDYISKPESITYATSHGTFIFTDVLGSVAEAKGAPIYRLNPMFVGMEFYVAASAVGLALLFWQYRVALILLPLLVLGFLSQVVGMRFAMFASPALALGFAYLSYLLATKLLKRTRDVDILTLVFGLVAVVIMVLNIVKLNPYLKPFHFNSDDVKALHELKELSHPDDLIISWWDFGWEIWYYTNVNNTLMDNGLHGSDTFLVANQLISSNQRFVASSSKYAADIKHHSKEVVPKIVKSGAIYDKFREFSKMDYVSKEGVNAYYLLHMDILKMLPTIIKVADTNPQSGTLVREREFYISNLKKPYSSSDPWLRGDTFDLDLRSGEITGSDGAKSVVNSVLISENGTLVASAQYSKKSPYFMIVYNRSTVLYMDRSLFNSFLIQSLLLDRYDKKHFEKVANTINMKIFKAK